MAGLVHDTAFDPAYGTAVEIVPGVRRLTARNPGPFTFHGTNTYLVGTRDLAVIDPGPEDAAHLAAVLAAADGARISAILVSHTHKDHSPGAAALAAATGAPVLGCAPHAPARALALGEINALDASSDLDFRADRELADGDTLTLAAGRFEILATPGHTANHLAFALPDAGLIFSADHVMAWSTSIVAPPDGSMQAYLASLDVLARRPEATYLPGHGTLVRSAHAYVEALRAHRLAREAAVLQALDGRSLTIPELVDAVYRGLDPSLKGAAALSVFAQLERLIELGSARSVAGSGLSGTYAQAR
ncbi:MBL fold metallo-hydrolase [Microvirga tunisiensis]|uniref:MBL fold metallo-hydrolase n=2 Tax=Pannonibacter tanglangensis TaxID=2750084 RepID=A0ABW9ZHH4_9HYPH|nr:MULTISPECIES: MBL fold metallo-hydrolase [unclassified Pannonibacter]NBN64310.1 MBL fold metallo-hydrolase [Pannonibacter sp. XCT-34]NBN78843.1 MBL fold metallo-hydrolase [Pannonibacter sp. XCT-53]